MPISTWAIIVGSWLLLAALAVTFYIVTRRREGS